MVDDGGVETRVDLAYSEWTEEAWHGALGAHVLPADVGGARWDQQLRAFVVTETEEWVVSVTPMIFNNRICLTHRSQYPFAYQAGWCYPKGPAAFLAALAWNPDTFEAGGEPAGFIKRAGE